MSTLITFKLLLLGETNVGKTSLIRRFINDKFIEKQQTTIGAVFLTKTILLDNKTIKLEIWDTAGQERYHSLAPMCYRNADGAIIVYDITNQDSFTRAKTWINQLKEQAPSDIQIILVGNKSDLGSNKNDATFFAENICGFFETSAKETTNVSEVFYQIAQLMIDKRKQDDQLVKPVINKSTPPNNKCCFIN
jgi:small GTP-binding protein